MTLHMEYRDGEWWLSALETPSTEPVRLAKFVSEDAAYAWKAAHARSMCFAREVGRQGV